MEWLLLFVKRSNSLKKVYPKLWVGSFTFMCRYELMSCSTVCTRSGHHWDRLPGKLATLQKLVDGLIHELPINFVLPDIQPLLEVASLQPMPLLYKTVTGSSGAALGLLFLSMSHEPSLRPCLTCSPRYLGICYHWSSDGSIKMYMGFLS